MNISLFKSISGQYPELRQINSVSVMNTISHLIEDQLVESKLAVDFYAGFQKFSNFPDQLRRYSRLGAICRRVYVFGMADYEPPVIPGIEFIEIPPGSLLAREWFLMVDAPEFWTTLVSQETEARELTVGGRSFDGLWSFNEQIVDRIALLISQIMESTYIPVQQRNHAKQSSYITEINSRLLNTLEKAELMSQRRWKQLHTLQQLIEVKVDRSSDFLQDAAKIIYSTFGAMGVIIALCSNNQDYMVVATAGEANGDGAKLPAGAGLVGLAIQQERLFQVDEVMNKNEGEPLLPTARSLIAAPILNRRVHGAICISNNKPNQWNSEDGLIIMAIGRLLAVQLEKGYANFNIKLLRKTNQSLQQILAQQQAPIARLAALQQRLQTQGELTSNQQSILQEMNEASSNLSKATRIAKRVLSENGFFSE
jgi:DICT domain-containing protein